MAASQRKDLALALGSHNVEPHLTLSQVRDACLSLNGRHQSATIGFGRISITASPRKVFEKKPRGSPCFFGMIRTMSGICKLSKSIRGQPLRIGQDQLPSNRILMQIVNYNKQD
jgi:hypothetical protein